MAEAPHRLRIFLCHSSGDKQIVRDLYKRLRADGFDPWLDEENLLPGQDWHHKISEAVGAADIVLVCLSRGSINKKGYVQKEIKYALDVADEQPENTIYLIPLKLEECDIPQRLRRWHWVNLFEETGYERLLNALRHRAESISVNPCIDKFQYRKEAESSEITPHSRKDLIVDSPHSLAPSSKIFISYRRSESAAYAGRLSDQLRAHFGSQIIFIDIESIEPGRDFGEAIEDAISSCKIVLVVIGRQWLTCANEHGRRLDDPKDFVRLEIAAALKRGIRVIPVLVQGAAIPREQDLPGDIAPLARRQAWEVSDLRWNQDVGKLIEKIAGDIPEGVRRSVLKHFAFPRTTGKRLLIQLAAAILFASAVIYALWPLPFIPWVGPPQSCEKSSESETLYYEAEDAILTGGTRRDREYLGFSGNNYVSGYGVEAAVGVEGAATTFEVETPTDGPYRVDLCYANGNYSPRSLTIYVNGERLEQTILPNAARWNLWRTQSETLPLKAGRNRISYVKSERDDGEVNLDFVGVSRALIIPASPIPSLSSTPDNSQSLSNSSQPRGVENHNSNNRPHPRANVRSTPTPSGIIQQRLEKPLN